MREIVHLQVGQCGNQVSSKFWEVLATEHHLEASGLRSSVTDLRGIHVYFNEVNGERYVPRTVLIDLEPGVLDAIHAGNYGGLYNPDSFIFGQSGAGNNWAKGFYTEGSELLEQALEAARKEAENSDCLQGFQLAHSLGGGSGSGLGTLLISKLKEEFSDRIIAPFSVFPSPTVSDTVTEPYNSILGINQLLENSDEVFMADNEAIYGLCSRALKLPHPTYADLNHVIAASMTGVTAGIRFPGQLNSNLRKLAVNLIPFPRLHFLTMSLAPLTSRESAPFLHLTVDSVTQQLFDPLNSLCAADLRSGRYLTAAAIYRGQATPHEVDSSILKFTSPTGSNFVPFLPSVVSTSLCDVPHIGLNLSAVSVANSTANSQVFTRIQNQFSVMLRRKAFLHWYTEEGMDESEFTEASSNVQDLICEYQQYQEDSGDSTYDDLEAE